MQAIDFNQLPTEIQSYLIWEKAEFIEKHSLSDKHIIAKYELHNLLIEVHYYLDKNKLEHISSIAKEAITGPCIGDIQFQWQYSPQ